MKITHTGSTPPTITAQTSSAPSPDAKARAIARLTQSAPVPLDQNNVSVEETVAIKAPSHPQGEAQPVEATESTDEGQTATNEAPKSPEAPKEDTASNQYVLLARKERALRAKAQQQDQAFKAREEALAAREAAISKTQQDYESGYISKAQLKSNTLQALADAGVTYEEVTQQQIDAGSVPQAVQAHIQRLEARLTKQEQDLAKAREVSEQSQSESYKAALNQIRQDATKLVKADPNFELVRSTNSVKDVVDLIEMTFKEEGRVMDVEEAAQLVEEHLLEEIDKLTRIEKIKKRLETKPAAKSPTNAQTPQTKQPQPMRTLTNATSSTRQMSAKERAILAFKGELKS